MTAIGFRTDVRVILLRRFMSEAIAHIYLLRLREAGIPCFLSNTHMSSMIPFLTGGFQLHIQETDLNEAIAILKELDRNHSTRSTGPFHDADLEDIRFEQQIARMERRMKDENSARIAQVIVLGSILAALGFVMYQFVSKML